MQGGQAYKWRQDGLQPNYWCAREGGYATADEAQVPLQLDQMPNDRMTLWRNSFVAGPPPPAVFALPDNCKPRCPLTSVCTVAANRGTEAPAGVA
ncbi:hypothetical protein GPECTOR_17g901 [Gonium pectorale]|uniref:Uncharacterized protein n=1 Tax=Gonium pectorale TaxID=33097 RepID=A0A150GK96_GONPE|nr:hypothetical protein GPECTOR_17g901 [Gonium pectorale]|eukprot:KXZ50263.1 hypothetical protein GPECTOR_17g901 [Gonium pectorale]